LEGSESLIPLLDLAIEKGGRTGHPRRSCWAWLIAASQRAGQYPRQKPREIFREFADTNTDLPGNYGDVKHHLGFSSDWTTAAGRKVHLSLASIPAISICQPGCRRVVCAPNRTVRRQGAHSVALRLLIHGDASFRWRKDRAREPSTSASFRATRGGDASRRHQQIKSLHHPPEEGRSQCLLHRRGEDVQIPIFHVNGENPRPWRRWCAWRWSFGKNSKRTWSSDM